MSIFNKYPYTDFHELNLDWILSKVRENEENIKNFINLNTIKYADPIAWDIESQYEANTVVIDPKTGDAFISTKAVPYGVTILNTDYWTPIFNYQNRLNEEIINRENGDIILQNNINNLSDIVNNKANYSDIIKVVNAKQYGLIGDGDTDNTAAFNNMINDVEVGTQISFDKGIYKFRSPISVNKSVKIIGGGTEVTTFIFNNHGLTLSDDFIELSNINFECYANCDFALKVSRSYAKIHDITVNDSEDYYFSHSIEMGSVLNGCWFNSLYNIYINNKILQLPLRSGTGIYFIGCVNSIANNLFILSKNNGIVFSDEVSETPGHTTDGFQGNNINIIKTNIGLSISSGGNILITDCIIDQVHGIATQLSGCRNVNIKGGYFGVEPSPDTQFGLVYMNNVNKCFFSNCSLFATNKLYGYTIFSSNNVSISDGQVINTTYGVISNSSPATVITNIKFEGVTNDVSGDVNENAIIVPIPSHISDLGTSYAYELTITNNMGVKPKAALCSINNGVYRVMGIYLEQASSETEIKLQLYKADGTTFNNEELLMSVVCFY